MYVYVSVSLFVLEIDLASIASDHGRLFLCAKTHGNTMLSIILPIFFRFGRTVSYCNCHSNCYFMGRCARYWCPAGHYYLARSVGATHHDHCFKPGRDLCFDDPGRLGYALACYPSLASLDLLEIDACRYASLDGYAVPNCL